MRPILPVTEVATERPTPHDAAGPAPQLVWLPIASLMVDETYQRALTAVGRRNVRAIAEAFRWSAFSPVIVSPVVGGRYAIVDGQHRTMAAALCGIEAVPCQVIVAGRDEQAEAFRQINGNTTRVHSMHLFHAAVAAGDPRAVATMDVARRAGVTILRSPTRLTDQKRGQTCAWHTIQRLIALHGPDLTVEALRAIARPAQAERGMLVPTVMRAVAEVLAERWRHHPPEALLGALDRINLIRELGRAEQLARDTGSPVAPILTRLVLGRLDRLLIAETGA
jgi:hypothetical protein